MLKKLFSTWNSKIRTVKKLFTQEKFSVFCAQNRAAHRKSQLIKSCDLNGHVRAICFVITCIFTVSRANSFFEQTKFLIFYTHGKMAQPTLYSLFVTAAVLNFQLLLFVLSPFAFFLEFTLPIQNVCSYSWSSFFSGGEGLWPYWLMGHWVTKIMVTSFPVQNSAWCWRHLSVFLMGRIEMFFFNFLLFLSNKHSVFFFYFNLIPTWPHQVNRRHIWCFYFVYLLIFTCHHQSRISTYSFTCTKSEIM